VNVTLLRETFAQLAPHADDVAAAFYARLFSTFPQLRPLFGDLDFREQRKKLMASLTLVVNSADRPAVLLPALDELGRLHGRIGTLPQHYPWVSATLLSVLADRLGPRWTPEVAASWEAALLFVSERMIAAQAGCEVTAAR